MITAEHPLVAESEAAVEEAATIIAYAGFEWANGGPVAHWPNDAHREQAREYLKAKAVTEAVLLGHLIVTINERNPGISAEKAEEHARYRLRDLEEQLPKKLRAIAARASNAS